MKRFNPNYKIGLTSRQVETRHEENLVNYDNTVKTKSIMEIIRNNLFTLFNLLNFSLAFLVLLVHSYKNLLFIGIVFCNTIISIIQAIKSKVVVDKLSIINATKTLVVRDNRIQEININEIVLDDVCFYKQGSQIVVDSIILNGEVEVNESFITGESELINYKENDLLKSGSFIVSGSVYAKVENIGDDNYTSKITLGSKYVKKTNSILITSLNKIIKVISIAIIPIGMLLFYNQYNLANNTIEQAILNTVAALIGMIPEGLVLLTSTVLAVSVIRLSRIDVLVQELYCIEALARVDTICLDKTGTLTTGKMKVEKVIQIDNNYNVTDLMGNIINYIENTNGTGKALDNYFIKKNNYHFIKQKPFSPICKYSGVSFKEGNFVIGAPEYLTNKKIKEVIDNQKNYRVLLLCQTSDLEKLNTKPIAIILLRDEIRASAKKILDYLKKQEIDIKIISGDNINTLKTIANNVGIKNIKEIDLTNVKVNDDIAFDYNIFGRVSPNQKKELIEFLQKNGRVVAMTGDGVNDVLALKQADCSITIKDATDAARNVSQIVLLNSSFDGIPNIIDEGRRTINNIERLATLFLSKTTYALLLALVFIIINCNYPFQPIQLTLTNFYTIGIPSLILALEPNHDCIKGNFLINVFSKSMPAALTIVLNIIVISLLSILFGISANQTSTLCVIMTGFTGFLLLIKLSLPFNKLRLSLVILLIIGFIFSLIGLKEFFALTILNPRMLILMSALVCISVIIFNEMTKVVDRFIIKYPTIFK